MSAIISTGNFPKMLRPGLNKVWDNIGQKQSNEYESLFTKASSDLSYEELAEVTGFGLVPVKAEGTDTVLDTEQQGTITRATHAAYSLGFKVTYEEIKFNQYLKVGKQRAARLRWSFQQTKETVLANKYNRAHDGNYTFGDGSAMCVTGHATRNGTQSNTLAAAADMSETTLEDMCIQIGDAKNTRGLQLNLTPDSIIIPNALTFEAQRIIKSTLQNDTANNAINAINNLGMFPGGIKVNHYLTDTDSFFIRTNVPSDQGMVLFQAEELSFDQDNDFPSKDYCARGYELYTATMGDFRSVYSNGGGA